MRRVLAAALLALPLPALAQEPPVTLPAPTITPEAVVEPPQAEPLPQPRPIKERRWSLVILGSGILVSSWVADRLVTADQPAGVHWVPLVGPFILVDELRRQGTLSSNLGAALVIDGLGQTAGAVLLTLGLVLTRERLSLRLPPRPATR